MHLFLWCLSMSFCRIMIKTCFLVTNHVLEITLFLLYIVNLSLMSITALIHSPCPKTQTSVFVWKMFKDTEKNTHYFSIRLNTRDCVLYSVDIFSRFSWLKEIVWTLSSSFTLLCGISEAAGCVSVMISCSVLTNEHPLHCYWCTEWRTWK